MAFKVNRVNNEINSYPHTILLGTPKIGKTSLFRDLILEKYKSPEYGLLISLGKEKGYKALDNLTVEETTEWSKEYGFEEEDLPEELWTRGLVEIIDDLIYNKKDYKFEIVGLDTVDELYELARQRVFYEHKNLRLSYPKSLNDAFGGYGKGRERLLDLIFTQLNRLECSGYHVILIGHTKQKDKLDPVSGLNYEQITNNLENKFWEALSGSAQWTINIVKDVNIEDFHTKGSGTTEKEVGKITRSERMMYFRDDNPLIDCGGRFRGLPEKLPLSAENFWKAFETGVENSRTGKITKKEKEEQTKVEKINKELISNNQKKKEEFSDSDRKDELFQKFKQFATLVRESGDTMRIKNFMNILSSNGITIAKFKDLPLSKMLELLKEVKDI